MQAHFTDTHVTSRGGRTWNEDCALSWMQGEHFCWVVADGLGGHGGGDIASRISCEAVLESFRFNPAVSRDAIQLHIRNADDAVRQEQSRTQSMGRMRSTILVLVANPTHAVVGHVGDTRFYHFRNGRILHQTRDHSVVQSLVDAGELAASEIRHHDDRNLLLRALGDQQPAKPTVLPHPMAIERGDAFLLCTDGFWVNVLDLEMEVDLAKSANPGEWVASMQTRLRQRVDGSHDNYTAVGVFADSLAAPEW